ncbi:SEC10/PgrA surface exclusion domain-containing protein [Streptococcus suis]|uniref:SEC10/PgrA surface exclusion domain-containing protein n=1 Tax=Streptococcus suis TaxID=1307 RepID=UPI00155678FD|nr:SEC10/PgrA surface exclusion domain-containing protein [Streptococcus suis]MCK3959953.1 SEC10/PgrA surface exclusion domain-containing protein [Streptococcus suis]NQJ87891.1 SEC10/PgrA surface exclusion domain-containing protein [Streptococcus suis]NQM24709.1 SEC10/PgrA surface exclusion domain-containing protein [Streptococcus suis]HEM2773056.1 SEC10/PgrA surface exclusion domain-containing protein [Streptococcus suis]
MKQLTVLSALATAVLSTGREVVHAEEVLQTTEPKPIAETSASQQATVTETDVATAKAELDKANQTVTAQEEGVNQAQNDVDTAKETVNQAQTELVESAELAEQATPENISKAKETINQAEDNITEASQNLEDKKQAEESTQQAVTDQEGVVSTAQTDVNEMTQAVLEAQKDVSTAQAILDGTGQAEVIAKAEQAEKQLTEAKQALVTAQTELATAQKADATRLSTIAQAEQTVSVATQDVASKTALVTEATDKATETASALQVAQDAFKVAENDLNALNTITLSSDYITALKEYGKTYSQPAKEKLDALITDLRKQNSFKANLNDSEELLDTNNLSEEARTELSLFASDLINQIRHLVGTKPTVVTKGALQLADATTDGYVADNWSWNDVGHDVKAVKQAAEKLGLKTGGQYYENMFTVSRPQPKMTISQAKAMIYQGLLNFMVGGYEYLHALSIAGLSNDVVYSGVDLSSRQDASSVHFLTVADSHIQSSSTFDTTAIQNLKTNEQILATYQTAQEVLAQATIQNSQAQAIKTQALQNQAVSQATLTQAQTDLATAQAVPVLTPQAQAKVSALEETVRLSNLANDKAQETLANLQEDVKVKQANLAKAKQILAQKQAILDKSKEQLSIEQEKLARLQSDLETAHTNVAVAQTQLSTAQSKLKEAQTYFIKLEEAPARLEIVKTRLLQATNSLKAKEATLTEALETLAELKQEEAKALNHYQTVLSAYQAVLEAQRQVELAKQYETIIHEGGQPVPVVDGTGRITGYVSEVPKAPAQTSKPITQTVPTKNTEASLPATGTKTSSLTVLGLALASLVFFSRKKKEG